MSVETLEPGAVAPAAPARSRAWGIVAALSVTETVSWGILFRRDSKRVEDGAHRNVFEANVIQDNLGPRPAKSNSRPSAAGKAFAPYAAHVIGLLDQGVPYDLEPPARSADMRDALDDFDGVFDFQLAFERDYPWPGLRKLTS